MGKGVGFGRTQKVLNWSAGAFTVSFSPKSKVIDLVEYHGEGCGVWKDTKGPQLVCRGLHCVF